MELIRQTVQASAWTNENKKYNHNGELHSTALPNGELHRNNNNYTYDNIWVENGHASTGHDTWAKNEMSLLMNL